MIIGPLQVVPLENLRVTVIEEHFLAWCMLHRQVVDEPLIVEAVRLRVLGDAEALAEYLLKQVATDA